MGSIPASATTATPASGAMCAADAGLSVTLTASAYPTSSFACATTAAGSAERGGTTSAVTQNRPERRIRPR